MENINIEEVFEKINWTELHKLKTLTAGYRLPIIIWADDGSLALLSSSGDRPNTERYYLYTSTWGWGNIGRDMYAEGWAIEEKDEYGEPTRNWIEESTGRVMTEVEMVSESIEEGDWVEMYEYWKDAFRRQFEEDLRNNADIQEYLENR